MDAPFYQKEIAGLTLHLIRKEKNLHNENKTNCDIVQGASLFYTFNSEPSINNLKYLLRYLILFQFSQFEFKKEEYQSNDIIVQISEALFEIRQNWNLSSLLTLVKLFIVFEENYSLKNMDGVMDLEQAAARLNISTHTLRKYADNGKVPTVMASIKGKRFIWEELLEWAKNDRPIMKEEKKFKRNYYENRK